MSSSDSSFSVETVSATKPLPIVTLQVIIIITFFLLLLLSRGSSLLTASGGGSGGSSTTAGANVGHDLLDVLALESLQIERSNE